MDTHLHWVWNGDQRRSFFLFQTNVGSSSPVLRPPMTNRAYSLLPSTSSTACSSLPTGYDTQYVVMCNVQCAMCISARHDGRDWPLCHPLRCQDSCISRSVPTVDLGLHCEWEEVQKEEPWSSGTSMGLSYTSCCLKWLLVTCKCGTVRAAHWSVCTFLLGSCSVLDTDARCIIRELCTEYSVLCIFPFFPWLPVPRIALPRGNRRKLRGKSENGLRHLSPDIIPCCEGPRCRSWLSSSGSTGIRFTTGHYWGLGSFSINGNNPPGIPYTLRMAPRPPHRQIFGIFKIQYIQYLPSGLTCQYCVRNGILCACSQGCWWFMNMMAPGSLFQDS